MVHGERKWFSRFLQGCEGTVAYRNPLHADHLFVREVVAECKSWREVEHRLRDYAKNNCDESATVTLHRCKRNAKRLTRLLNKTRLKGVKTSQRRSQPWK